MVAHHVFILLQERGIDPTVDWVGGGAGVDLFFPISGFVMVLSTHGTWDAPERNRTFFLRRLVRIAPLYWILTSAKLALLLAFPAFALRSSVEGWHTAASYLFVPARNVSSGDGHPVLPVGWTLNLEMFFYAVFAVALITGKRPVLWTAAILSAVGLFGMLPLSLWDPVRFYADPIIVEFAFGMIVGCLVIKGRILAAPFAWIVALLSGVIVMAAEYVPGFSADWRLWVWGLPSTLFLYAMVSLEGRFLRTPGYKAALLVGDASYSIYLSHGFVLTAVGIVCSKLGYTGRTATFGILLVCLGASVALGVGLHRFVEAPLTRFLNARLRPRRRAPAVPPLPAPP